MLSIPSLILPSQVRYFVKHRYKHVEESAEEYTTFCKEFYTLEDGLLFEVGLCASSLNLQVLVEVVKEALLKPLKQVSVLYCGWHSIMA